MPQAPSRSLTPQAPQNPAYNHIQDPADNWWEEHRRQDQQPQYYDSVPTDVAPTASETPTIPRNPYVEEENVPQQSDELQQSYNVS